jgi:hypothetical protein
MPEIPIFFGHAAQRLLGERGINGGLARNLPLPLFLQYSRRDLASRCHVLSASC